MGAAPSIREKGRKLFGFVDELNLGFLYLRTVFVFFSLLVIRLNEEGVK